MTTLLTSSVTRAVMDHLSDSGIGQLAAVHAFAGALPGLTVRDLPASPDRIIAVTCYWQDHLLELPTSVVRVQVRCRGAAGRPLDADDLADAVFPLLHGVHHARWGGVEISRCRWVSSTPLGADSNNRPERTDNYEITTQRSTP